MIGVHIDIGVENLLKTSPKDYEPPKRGVIHEYKNLKQSIKGDEWLIEYYEKQIAELEEKIEMNKKSVERIKKDIEKNKREIQAIFDEKRKG